MVSRRVLHELDVADLVNDQQSPAAEFRQFGGQASLPVGGVDSSSQLHRGGEHHPVTVLGRR